ncbi:uncharacterized protein PHACADRAFT_206742 [Phanerochaete carnosa HHB-10118-sp]|uniref:Uncharacterized protein n=1 Tax=Phanerochaete carnosa (strain HHB-10118-sp) TaxID=650164 RepID=K5X4X1_PHACS|nr:uncharacterized protein PHACADRAFT_206742 [Phanerochaete carnosa HHB-10118-sp]EKM57872.1 hypothetical protein PHACADRAFT_206742 [Phanerochaete carnosa HHB-10118-sp]
MKDYDIPKVDRNNPLYCPSVPAVVFLESIRRKIHDKGGISRESTPEFSPDHENRHSLSSFTRLLDKSVTDDDLLELLYNPGHSETLLGNGDNSGDTNLSSVLQGVTSRGLTVPVSPQVYACDCLIKEEESSISFSDLRGPAKREMSLPSGNEGSFEISGKADPIVYFARSSSPYNVHRRCFLVAPEPENGWRARAHELQEKLSRLGGAVCLDGAFHSVNTACMLDELYGAAVGTETPRGMRNLISRLDKLLPGVRLTTKLSKVVSHQDIIDILCSNGFVNTRVLDAFRTSEVEFLDLTTSLAEEDGLNMDARDILKVLAKPNSFLFVHEINLSGTTLRDSDIACLHHLPRLARLWLQDTGVTNQAVFLLLPLKRCLQELDIAYNPDINDDVIVAFDMLSRLSYLKLLGTSITIAGVRRLTTYLRRRGYAMALEVPASCEDYLRQLHLKYISHPGPPLITDPKAAQNLTPTALSRNLAAHAAVNPDIPTKGSKAFLANQLGELLENRRADLYARELIGLD